jgi:hypothetical protein
VTNSLIIRVSACLLLTLLAGCSFVQDTIINSVVGFPATHAVRDVHSTSAEYEEEQHQMRVDELSRDYEAFVQSKEGCTVEPTSSPSLMAPDQTNAPESPRCD